MVDVGVNTLELGYITQHRLSRISRDLGLIDCGETKVGSTWYGPSKIVQTCANLSMSVMYHISTKEFTKLEKSSDFAGMAKNWPEWHYGVLTLYAGQIAVNHCAAMVGYKNVPDQLDYRTDSNSPIAEHAHLHAWQGGGRFAKDRFYEGKYADEKLEKLDLTRCDEYAMYMALSANPCKLMNATKRC
eukprot:TRINITY_DN898_c1_g2_i2.p1 TRINITY_DN898_c1_g2~~TRINITY_DN898_c1_g2_i2.p1  ORF type:complete len:187 (-),score=28.56 TRINITY_DN898_c1_g2_i2:239-799(-)